MAVAEHGGEVKRNPYHVFLPARLIDNVRRGAEVVGGQGAHGCDFTFGELYRVSSLKGRKTLEGQKPTLIIKPEGQLHVPELFNHFSLK